MKQRVQWIGIMFAVAGSSSAFTPLLNPSFASQRPTAAGRLRLARGLLAQGGRKPCASNLFLGGRDSRASLRRR
jgi:hypothetical protein